MRVAMHPQPETTQRQKRTTRLIEPIHLDERHYINVHTVVPQSAIPARNMFGKRVPWAKERAD